MLNPDNIWTHGNVLLGNACKFYFLVSVNEKIKNKKNSKDEKSLKIYPKEKRYIQLSINEKEKKKSKDKKSLKIYPKEKRYKQLLHVSFQILKVKMKSIPKFFIQKISK